MKKPCKKWLALTALAGMSLCLSGVHMAGASEVVYDDSNVSITSAVDRYIATNDNPVANIVEGYEEDKDQTLQLGDASNTVNSGKPTATIEEVKAPESATGTVKVNNITGEVTVVDPNAATTEEAVQTTEATPATESTTTQAQATYDNTSTDGFVYALAEPDMTGRAVVTASGSVNIRESGTVDSPRVGNINAGGILTVKEKGSEWSLVTSNGVTGYIKNEFLAFDADAATYAASNLKKVVKINTASLRVRAAANENSETLTLVTEGNAYGIEEIGAGWTKIHVDDSVSGYVRNDYIILDYTGPVAHVVTDAPANSGNTGSTGTTENTTTESTGITTPPSTNIGQDIVNYALQFVGNPYVYGGTSLTNGADCSGFVMRIYADFGYSIPRTADVQGTVGTEVSLSALAPGDLVFYDNGTGSIKHVALYIGNGQVVHASSSTTGIIISNVNYKPPCKAVRIIN
ncbi:MAG: peptidoglycan endopeptidase [Lachnospiraceae bacterium]|nr:peptidoglycan endopeptidase [Lachnospiraceae bacterium]